MNTETDFNDNIVNNVGSALSLLLDDDDDDD